MADHPTDNVQFWNSLAALDSGDVPSEALAGVSAAQQAASVVVQAGLALDALKPHVATLQIDAAACLAGAAHLILVNNWLQRAEEADTVRDQARARIAALS
jgi:hypothetical protein